MNVGNVYQQFQVLWVSGFGISAEARGRIRDTKQMEAKTIEAASIGTDMY